MKETLLHHTAEMLRLGKQVVTSQPLRIEETGIVNPKGDRSIAMDVEVEKAFIDRGGVVTLWCFNCFL